MRTEAGWTVLQVTTLLLVVLATVAILHSMWFLLVLALAASLTSSFCAHRHINERLNGGHPRHGDHMD